MLCLPSYSSVSGGPVNKSTPAADEDVQLDVRLGGHAVSLMPRNTAGQTLLPQVATGMYNTGQKF